MLKHFIGISATLLALSAYSGLQAADSPPIDQVASRIQAHFTLKDYQSAYQEAYQAVKSFPNSQVVLECYIEALAYLGLEHEMLEAWQNYVQQFPDQSLNRHLIEGIAWSVLNKAAHSPSLVMRQMALLAALFSQDIKGISVLHEGLQDSNYAIRASAVELCSQLPDAKLIKRVKTLYKEEKSWLVRQKVIQAIGSMKIHELKPELEALIASDESLAEERALAIEALLDLLNYLERREIIRLVQSNRAGLRLLACQAIPYFQSLRDLDQLFILSQDFNSDVRLAALQAIGLLRPQTEIEKILTLARERVGDSNKQVAITAAWLLTLYAPPEGMMNFANFLNSPIRNHRVLAAAALKSTGRYGASLSLKVMSSHSDPYVRLNLAMHLAGQRLAQQEVCQVLEELVEKDKSKWCRIEMGVFEVIATNQIFKDVQSESTPEMEDQLIRLEILNLLAILKSPHAQVAIKQFLTERSWGISGAAAILLLSEGDDLAIDLVQNLLKDPQPKVRLQAALVLSLWSQEESAIQTLEQSYRGVSQEQKCRILEAIARIGSMQSIPFLIEVLHEPSQTLRLIAALGIIQCLDH